MIVRHPDEQVTLSEEAASGGEKGTGLRYALAISLLLAVIVMSAIWIIPASG